jgi:hypothetical protein
MIEYRQRPLRVDDQAQTQAQDKALVISLNKIVVNLAVRKNMKWFSALSTTLVATAVTVEAHLVYTLRTSA